MAVLAIVSGCSPLPDQALAPSPVPSQSPTLGSVTETPTLSSTHIPVVNSASPIPSPVPTVTATSTLSPTEPPVETYIAYVQNDSLLVTHVMSGKRLETHEYIKSPQSQGILRVGWSPSGDYLTFTMLPDSSPHIYIVNVKASGKPIDLGIADLGVGNDWAWSPDSKLLAFEHEYELWVYSPVNGIKKQLTKHLGVNWLWSQPVFTPDGKALWAVGTNSNNMDSHGNTRYKIYRVPLDGSGANDYPPGHLASVTAEISGGTPLDLRFSPDGQKVAIILTMYVDNCAQTASFQVGNALGKEIRNFPVPSLAAVISSQKNLFFYGDSLVWDPQSDGLWVNGVVRECTIAERLLRDRKYLM